MADHKVYIGLIGDVDGFKEVTMTLSDFELETIRKVQKALNNAPGSIGDCWIYFDIRDLDEEAKKRKQAMQAEAKRKKEEAKKKEEEAKIRANRYKDDANPMLAAYRKALEKKKE